ncbi:MAG: type II toxin-antitoxin system RelE/ParE family toxin [Syntrophaceae bacterium]|jgi:proteic killer suppression protein|nr:type II toxin-antitoxin system RelE/ParE family toxin [Syntrophaceae bacterium]
MIKTFRCKDTASLFDDRLVLRFKAVERQARRKLAYLHRARNLQDLRQPPGNQLEALKGERKGQFSIRINDQWRICFTWESGDAYNVEIVDYHLEKRK